MNDTQPEPEFRDHYYTLGIDIDASGEVVEQTYWQHVRASRESVPGPLGQSPDIEDLSEAYRVLMTPELRNAYDEERTQVLGANAAPTGPAPAPLDLPLRVMETQLPAMQIRADLSEEVEAGGWSLPVPARLLAGGVTVFATATLVAVRWILF